MEFFDTHAHYDDSKFDEDRDKVIESLKLAGVTKCVNIGCNIENSIKTIEIANTYDFMYAAIRNSSK